MEKVNFTVYRMQPGDLDGVLEIAGRVNLSEWVREDYEQEISRKDNVSFIVRNENAVVGFIAARLIRLSTNALYNTVNRSVNSSVNSADNSNVDSAEDSTDKNNPTDRDETKIVCEVEILNIAVTEGFQLKGIGKLLLKALTEELKDFDEAVIRLEVRNSNRQAIAFYRRQLFEESYKRKDYYVQPVEDAIVMVREIGKNRKETEKETDIFKKTGLPPPSNSR